MVIDTKPLREAGLGPYFDRLTLGDRLYDGHALREALKPSPSEDPGEQEAHHNASLMFNLANRGLSVHIIGDGDTPWDVSNLLVRSAVGGRGIPAKVVSLHALLNNEFSYEDHSSFETSIWCIPDMVSPSTTPDTQKEIDRHMHRVDRFRYWCRNNNLGLIFGMAPTSLLQVPENVHVEPDPGFDYSSAEAVSFSV